MCVSEAADKELTTRSQRIRAVLTRTFSPADLDIADDSGRHAGHAGAAPGGETHFNVRIRAEAFRGLTRVARHRAVMDVLAEEFATGLHALSIDARAPGE